MSPDEPKQPVVEMEDVALASSQMPGRAEVEAVNWTVSAGDYWVVGGLHGSGKSDLLAAAAGLVRPLRGTVRLFGRDTAGVKESELVAERLKIGLVFEAGGRLFRDMTVMENVSLALRYHFNWPLAELDRRARAVLKLTELEPFIHITPPMLSANWQQRVALARTLALKPELLLLDKPLLGLEVRHRRWWLDFLSHLSRGMDYMDGKPVTLVVTSDDFHDWHNQGRQFALLSSRRWVCLGGREQLKRSQEPLLRELLPDEDVVI
jgi:ABC-type transporter Mla maintaining outer membrane lipid asymmetry ATPase subunit MlaF